jgi:squalene-associated FAD-dependent desaturase
MSRHVVVVGAGWSGLASALTLLDHGAQVTLIEAAPQPGGRARRVDVTLGDANYALDNGQHLLLGSYRETLRLIARAGLDPGRLLMRLPFELRHADGLVFAARHVRAPWHLATALLTARGYSWPDRISIVRDVIALSRQRWKVARDVPARAVFCHATRNVVRRLWNPLCLAALNVPLEAASAQIFLNVLADSLGATAASSDLMLPRRDLAALFPSAAVETLQRAGVKVLFRHSVMALQWHSAGGWTLTLRDGHVEADAVVLALPADRAESLLAGTGLPALGTACAQLRRIATAPITTVYLRYPAATRLHRPMLALDDDPSQQRFAQWIFDRGMLDPSYAGVFAAVISGEGPHQAIDRDAVAAAVARQLADDLALPPSLACFVIVEKHATIKPGPGLQRPAAILPAAGLFLAGDAADSPYPSTIEGSVRAGCAAARAALNA